MYKDKLCIGLVLAGGEGSRMKQSYRKNSKAPPDIPKQYMLINGIPILAYSLRAFQEVQAIDHIYLVAVSSQHEFCLSMAAKFKIDKLKQIVPAGNNRQHSVYNGLMAMKHIDEALILVHDAARPFVRPADIMEIIQETYTHRAAILAAPVVDTIKATDGETVYRGGVCGEFVSRTLNRNFIYAAQTPQGTYLSLLLKAHKQAIEEGFMGSDDSSVLENISIYPKIVPSSPENFKITTQQDLEYAIWRSQR